MYLVSIAYSARATMRFFNYQNAVIGHLTWTEKHLPQCSLPSLTKAGTQNSFFTCNLFTYISHGIFRASGYRAHKPHGLFAPRMSGSYHAVPIFITTPYRKNNLSVPLPHDLLRQLGRSAICVTERYLIPSHNTHSLQRISQAQTEQHCCFPHAAVSA